MSGGNALHDLISKGSIREALDLINSGVWLEETDDQERTALILAVKGGYVDLIKVLIAKGVDPNKKDKYGRTALHYAALSRSEEVSKMLLKEGADPLIKDNKGKIASKYINPSKYPDLYKLYKKAEKLQKALIAKQKSLESQRKKVSTANINLNMYLALAINNRDMDSIVRLIQMGADVNTHGLNGSTALHVALEKGKGVIVQQLVDHGANVTATDGLGITPLKLAQRHGIVIVTHVNAPNPEISRKSIEPVNVKPIQLKTADVGAIIKAAHVTNIEQSKILLKTEDRKILQKPVIIDVAKDLPPVVRKSQMVVSSSADLPKASIDMNVALQSAPRIPSASKVQDASHAVPLIPSATPSVNPTSPVITKQSFK